MKETVTTPVPSVQEIAKEGLSKVPERYVRPQNDRPILPPSTDAPNLLPQVPVIDFANLLSHDLKAPELDKLHYACKTWGFFQLINHGVSTSLLEKVKKGAEEFFQLPTEEKNKFEQIGDVQGYGQAFVLSDEQKLDWADMFFMTTLPRHSRKSHLFPNIPLPFRDDLEGYCAEMESLAIQILDLMADALSIDPLEIRERFGGEATQSIRMNYYPPCPEPELVMGLSSHSDGGGLTILLQANEVQGLQVKKDGLWIPIEPLPNAFIINLGDLLEMITNGVYISVEHRATVHSEKERLSIATFYSPSPAAMIDPAPSLVTAETPAVFNRITAGDYFKGYLAQELRGKSFLDTIRIHPHQNHKTSS